MWYFVVSCLDVTTLLLFASIGELLNQRSGVLNVGIEGLMLASVSLAFITTKITGSFLLGFMVGMATGSVLGLLHGFLSITLKVDQVVSGLGIWIFALGFTTYIAAPYAGPLGRIPLGGRIFDISPFFFIGIAVVFIIWVTLFKSNLGLKIRSVGEDPLVAEVSGIKVERLRYLCVVTGGSLGGLSGAYLALSYSTIWAFNPTMGRGWIALALVFLSMWKPWILLGGSLLFGTVWQLALSPELIPILPSLPLYFYRMIPFAVTIVVMVLISMERFRKKWGLAKPAALGLPYLKE